MTSALAPSLLAAGVALLALAVAEPTPAAWLINESPSVPIGLYRRDAVAPRAGAVVALRPPTEALFYLETLGAPPDARLLKRVAAGPGAGVCWTGGEMEWGARKLEVQSRDRRGAPLPAPRGCRRLGADEFLVVGDTPASFDSRYFGPVRRAQIEGVYEEVLTW